MITQGYIPISDDQTIPQHKRGVKWWRFIIDRESRVMTLITKLAFFEVDTNESDSFGRKLVLEFERNLIASNARKVNEVGNVVTRYAILDGDGNETGEIWKDINGNAANATFGQFDFFEMVASSQPVQVYPFIDSIIIQEDAIYKTYNQFSPYEN